ncbi:Glyoxylate/hydroxypyruvate reductase [Gigaspora margarita]|uniref:Glyoxylate/hydroxypyruvate reductase n=1 Tax=Gigaspora margarita TaxID=4874 RepID=A0A8H4ERF0_GIGMA|nr:Glyoxylate/hydroxypyruvate reductase [Gigaspora margarita]
MGLSNRFYNISTHSSYEYIAKCLTILLFTLIFVVFMIYDIRKVILAKSYPLIETKFEVRERLYMPGIVICGPNMNIQPKCYLGLTGTKGNECDNHWWTQRPIEQFKFIFPDTIGEGAWLPNAKNCYILTPPYTAMFTPNLTEEMTIHLYSNETVTSISSIRRWVQFGIFWPWMGQDPYLVRPDFFNLPSETLFTFSRKELYKLDGKLLITYDVSPARRALPIFTNNTKKWGEIHIRPDYEPALGGYEITVSREHEHFTIYDLLPTFGGCIGILFLIYKLLWGDNRLNPFGLFQKFIFRSIPKIFINHFSNGYDLNSNIIVLDHIEKPQSVIVKSSGKGFKKIFENDIQRNTNYPFKGFGPEQLDEMRNSLLGSGVNLGIGGNVVNNQPTNSDQLKDHSRIGEVENVRKEIDQLRQEYLDLKILLTRYLSFNE